MITFKLNFYSSIESSSKEPTFHVLAVKSYFSCTFLSEDFYKCFGLVIVKRILYCGMFTNKKLYYFWKKI